MRTNSHAALTVVSALAAIAALASFGCGKKSEPAEVVITLNEAAAPLSSATVLVDYSQASATLVKTAGEPACAAIVPNMTAHFSDDGQGRMTIQADAPQGISAPVDLAVCRMIPDAPGIDGKAIASRLRISLVAGADRAGAALDEKKLTRAGGKRDGAEPAEGERQASAERAAGETGVAGERAARGHQGAAGATAEAPAAAAPPDERLAAVPREPAAAVPGGTPPAAEPKALVPPANSNRSAPPAGDGGGEGAGDDGGDTGEDGQDPGEADANDDSDTDRSARSYSVTVGVTNAAGLLGALQFDISYRGGGRGGFAGAAGSARCQTEIPAALATFNDKGNGTLSGALVDLDGIQTPGAVATCTFKSRENVSAADFSIRVVDAADPAGEKPPHPAQMGVQNLSAQ